MESKTYVYLTPATEIWTSWSNADPANKGWPDEGGHITFKDMDQHEAAVTVYVSRAQLLRLKDVIDRTIEAMPTAGSGLDGARIVSSAA